MGRRLEGNLPRAHEVQGTARLLVQQCLNEIGYRGGWGQAVRQLALRDGTIVKAIVIKNIRGFEPIVRVEVFAPQHADSRSPTIMWTAYTVWEPEGLFITPRDTEAASQGWGMPRLDHDYNPINAPKGTPYNTTHYNEWFAEGAIKQVILNRFRNNKYPDYWIARALEAIEDPGHPRDLVATTWPFFAEPSDPLAWFKTHVAANGDTTYTVYATAFEQFPPDGGISLSDRLGEPLPAQDFIFDNDFLIPLFAEIEEADWFCHWPEERPYQGPNAELRLKQFELVNDLRESAGLERLTLPIRGYDCSVSDITLQQVQKSNTLAHNSLYFDEGYQGAYHRFVKDGTPVSAGENLAGGVQPEEGLSISEVMFNGWVDSPVHYANMLNPYWTVTEPIEDPPIITGRSGELQFSLGGTSIKRVTDSYTGWTAEDLEEPVSGAGGCQTFISREQWVESGTLYWENEDASQRCSWFTWRPFRYALLSRDDAMYFCYNRFFYKGRRQHIETKYLVLGVALCAEDMTFRIGAYNVVTDSLDVLRLPRNLPYVSESSLVDVETIGSYSIDSDDVTSFSYMHFSQDGKKCVFAIASCADEPANMDYKWLPLADVGYVSDTTYGPIPSSQITSPSTWGKLRHIEFSAGSFTTISTSITTNTRRTGPGECPTSNCYDVFWWEFAGEFNVYADYVNNSVVYAKVRIDYGSYWAETSGAPTMRQRVGWIKKELVCGDFSLMVQESGKYHNTFDNGAIFDTSTLCELYHFDLRNVGDVCYSEIKIPPLSVYDVWDGTSSPTTRKLYVKNELVWESEAVPRFTNSELGACSRLDFSEFETTLIISHDAPKAYPVHGRASSGGSGYSDDQITMGTGTVGTEPTSPFLALGPHYMNGPEIWEFWPGSGLNFGPTPSWCIESEGFISRHIPNDGAGFTMFDSIRFVQQPVFTTKGAIGNYPSALPWVQRLSTDADLPVHCTLHNTFGVFVRYRDKWVFTLRVDHFGAVPFNTGSLVPNGPGFDTYAGESYTAKYNERIAAVDWSVTRIPAPLVAFEENDARWRTFSNLDLATMTSTDNLSQNIWPMGVI